METTDSTFGGLSQVRLGLRRDLGCSLHEYGGLSCYVVEDPVSSQFYRLGVREWTFVSFLDGKNTVGEALELAAESLGPDRLTSADAKRLCEWLVKSKLALVEGAPAGSPGSAAGVAPARRSEKVLLNPLCARIPLCNPDRFLAAVLPWFQWILSFRVFNIWLCLCSFGLYEVFSNWSRFTAASADLVSPDHWPVLLAIWLLLKVFHEAAHGLACKKYGGTVPVAGVTLILFSPIAYIDLTSCWRIRSKWQRIFTSAAGMYVELAIAAVAALIWSHTKPGAVNYVAHKAVLMTGLTTIVFNINPLMRFDGYYILSDWLGITNLYPRGQAYVRYLGLRYLLGVETGPTPETGRVGRIVKVYGVATLLWRILVCISLAAAAATLFHGLGLVLTFAAIVCWLGLPAIRLAGRLVRGDGQVKPNLLRVALRLSLAACLVAAVLAVPWPSGVVVPAIVEYSPLAVIHVDSPGFVEEIRVRDGETVEPGQVLAILCNAELRTDLQDLELKIQQCLIRQRTLFNDGQLVKYQVEVRNAEALETKRKQLHKRIDGLVLRSPVRGRVIARQLELLRGQYVASGREIMSIGVESRKELKASVAQADIDQLRADVGSEVYVRLDGDRRSLPGTTLGSIAPRASCLLPHPALGAQTAGPLAVQPKNVSSQDGEAASLQYELLAPRFDAHIEIPGRQACGLRAGQKATVRLNWSYATVGTRLVGWLVQTIHRRAGLPREAHHAG